MRLRIQFKKYPLESLCYKVLLNEDTEFPFDTEADKELSKAEADTAIDKILGHLMRTFKTPFAHITHTATHITYDFAKENKKSLA